MRVLTLNKSLILAAALTMLSGTYVYANTEPDPGDSSQYHLKSFQYLEGGSSPSGTCWNYRCGGGWCCYIS
jgi:hypothetical protein